jgi:hypothetical protein
LEAVNNPQSHELLKSLGDRFPDTWLAGEAGAALARLSTKNRDGK